MKGLVLLSVLSVLFSVVAAAAKKRFIFRQDDVEDYYNTNVQVSLINFFMTKGVPLSAGIIGDYFTGEDTVLYNTLKSCVALGPEKCALFNHGSDAEFTFGSATSLTQAYTPLKRCDDKIKSLFNNYHVRLFVPHQNSWNALTLQAVAQLGYDAISASNEDYSGMTWDLAKNPIQMPQQSTTGLWLPNDDWAANPASAILSDCNAAYNRGEVCVIMIHPHEFANGAYTLTMLQQVITTLTNAGFEATSFETVINEAKGSTRSPTAAPTLPAPTAAPTAKPTTAVPSRKPTAAPTVKVTVAPTTAPTTKPTVAPTVKATVAPTTAPTTKPTVATAAPTVAATTAAPTVKPTVASTTNPTVAPTTATAAPTTAASTTAPTIAATTNPTVAPTVKPTTAPTAAPTTVAATTAPTTATTTTAAPTTASTTATSKKRFIFRFDNIEDWYHSDTQVNLLNFFMDKGLGVTASIFGDYFSGADTTLYNTLKRCVSLGTDKCALSNLGSDAKFSFGTAKSVTAATSPIQKCDTQIKKLFPNYTPKVFTPFDMTWNTYTLQALTSLGYDAISASTEEYSGMTWDLSKAPYQMPQMTTTGLYTDSGDWVANPAATVLADCQAVAAKGQVCVIAVHPDEFANGQYTLQMLQGLVDSLVAAGFTSTNFQTVINEAKGVTPAPTAAPTAKPTLAPNTVITASPTVKPTTGPAKRFIIRQDDVEDYYHNTVQANLLNFFMDRGIGVSAGIIGDYVSGQDAIIYNVLKRCVSLGSDKCALFNHGTDARFRFGDTTVVLNQIYQLQKCDQKISSLFPGYKTQLFVPHQNSWNAQTLQALQTYGYDAISASIESYSNMAWDLTKNPLQMPQQTTTGIYTSQGTWAANAPANIVKDCNAAAARGEVCVIMIHPHEFSSGAYTLTMMQQVIDGLTAAGFQSTNFPTIINEVKSGVKSSLRRRN